MTHGEPDPHGVGPLVAPLIPCAGAVVLDAAGRLLMIERAKAPAAGTWSLPGGRCERGETAARACVREVAEETGLEVEVVRPAGTVERAAPGGGTYVIDDFVCAVVGGALRAGDDAAAARWVSRRDLQRLTIAPGVVDALAEWGLLPT